MATQISKEQERQMTNRCFFAAVLPLLKTILADTPAMQKKWQKRKVCQVSCWNDEGTKNAIYFIFEDGACTPALGEAPAEEKIDLELEFSSIDHMNGFFKNTTKKLPKLKGALKQPGLLVNFLMLLLKMAGLLGLKGEPKKKEDLVLLVKCMFYLLPRGINILNKMGHPDVAAWTEKSPDRVYGWAVEGYPELASHLRIKKGMSMARKGAYTKSMPFFTMKFDSPESALGILQSREDMIQFTIEQKLIMVGGPEFGAQIGDHMMLVGSLIQ